MSAESESERNPLPFEPRQKRKKKAKKQSSSTPPVEKKQAKQPSSGNQSGGIPEAVSRRMIRRMALFSGIPTSLAIGVFILSYLLISQAHLEIPTPAVLITSSTFFLFGVVGLSYGVISTSWDENRAGSWFGLDEFKVNFGRMRSAWRESREAAKGK